MSSSNIRRAAQLRRWRIRKKVSGTVNRPRMSVRFTEKNIHVQFVDDVSGHTLAAVSTIGSDAGLSANVAGAVQIGKAAAAAAREKGISTVVFDRSGARYHGKVKALADAAREAGLQF